ncbi:MAG: XdhC family protein [bacterium]|nr:XdhC family protein [bacterium]
MEMIFQTLQQRLLQQESLMLLSVVRSHGSAPRGAGAHMLVCSNGILGGTIGGGALEHQAALLAQEWLCSHAKEPSSVGFLRHFVLNTEEVQNLGMVCGGEVDVLFTPFLSSPETLRFVSEISTLFSKREVFWLCLPLNAASPSRLFGQLPPEVAGSFSGPYGIATLSGEDCYFEKMVDGSRVFIFGGGHISQELVPLLSHLKFRCIVSDDRPEFLTPALFPTAEELRHISFLHLDESIHVKEGDSIVVLTRGHVWDTDVQRFALHTPARYIGVVGSRKKKAAVFATLREDGFPDSDLARIVTPIGLDIGAQTPAEIAISIAAQMIAVRNGL